MPIARAGPIFVKAPVIPGPTHRPQYTCQITNNRVENSTRSFHRKYWYLERKGLIKRDKLDDLLSRNKMWFLNSVNFIKRFLLPVEILIWQKYFTLEFRQIRIQKCIFTLTYVCVCVYGFVGRKRLSRNPWNLESKHNITQRISRYIAQEIMVPYSWVNNEYSSKAQRKTMIFKT